MRHNWANGPSWSHRVQKGDQATQSTDQSTRLWDRKFLLKFLLLWAEWKMTDIFHTITSLGQCVHLTTGQEAPKCHGCARPADYPRIGLQGCRILAHSVSIPPSYFQRLESQKLHFPFSLATGALNAKQILPIGCTCLVFLKTTVKWRPSLCPFSCVLLASMVSEMRDFSVLVVFCPFSSFLDAGKQLQPRYLPECMVQCPATISVWAQRQLGQKWWPQQLPNFIFLIPG